MSTRLDRGKRDWRFKSMSILSLQKLSWKEQGYVKMAPEAITDAERKACKYLVRVEGYSYREAERILNFPPRRGMKVWEYVHDKR